MCYTHTQSKPWVQPLWEMRKIYPLDFLFIYPLVGVCLSHQQNIKVSPRVLLHLAAPSVFPPEFAVVNTVDRMLYSPKGYGTTAALHRCAQKHCPQSFPWGLRLHFAGTVWLFIFTFLCYFTCVKATF